MLEPGDSEKDARGQAGSDRLCQELLRTHAVHEKTFNQALQHFSVQHLVELTSLIGLYAQNVFYLNAFGMELPANSTEPKMRVGLELEDDY